MKTYAILLGGALAACTAIGCAAPEQELVHVPAVSMSIKSVDPGQQATAIGPVNVQYCEGDPPITGQDSNVGLMDQAIAKAEKQTNASYISDAQFFTKGACVILQGTAMRVASSSAGQ